MMRATDEKGEPSQKRTEEMTRLEEIPSSSSAPRRFGTDLSSSVRANPSDRTVKKNHKIDKANGEAVKSTLPEETAPTKNRRRPTRLSFNTTFSPQKDTNLVYTVAFDPGPVGIKLEAVVADVGCRVLSVSSVSEKIRPGDLVVAVNATPVLLWKYPDILQLLQSLRHQPRKISFRSVWGDAPPVAPRSHNHTTSRNDALSDDGPTKHKTREDDDDLSTVAPVVSTATTTLLPSTTNTIERQEEEEDRTTHESSLCCRGGPPLDDTVPDSHDDTPFEEEENEEEVDRETVVSSSRQDDDGESSTPPCPSQVQELSKPPQQDGVCQSKPRNSLWVVRNVVAPAAGAVAYGSYSLTSSLTSSLSTKLGEALVGHTSTEFDRARQIQVLLLSELSHAKAALDQRDSQMEEERAQVERRAKEEMEQEVQALCQEKACLQAQLRKAEAQWTESKEQQEADRIVFNETVDELKHQVRLLESEKGALEATVEKERCSHAQREEEWRSTMAATREEKASLTERIQRVQAEVQHKDTELSSSKTQWNDLEKEFESRENLLQARLRETAQVRDGLQSDLNHLRHDLDRTMQDKARLEYLSEDLQLQLDNSVAKLTALERFQTRSTETLQAATQRESALKARLDESLQAGDRLKSDADRLRQELDQTIQERDRLQSVSEDLQVQLRNRDATLTALETLQAQSVETLRAVTQRESLLSARLDETVEARDSLQSNAENLKQELDKVLQDRDRLLGLSNDLQMQLNKSHERLTETVQATQTESNAVVEELRVNAEKNKTALGKALEDNEVLRKEIEETKQDRDRLQCVSQNLQTQLNRSDAKVVALEMSLASSTESLQATQDITNAEVESLRGHLQEKDRILCDAVQAAESLQAKHDALTSELRLIQSVATQANNDKTIATHNLEKKQNELVEALENQKKLELRLNSTERELHAQLGERQELDLRLKTLSKQEATLQATKASEARLSSFVKTLETRVEEGEIKLAASRMNLVSKTGLIDELQQEISEKDETLDNLTAEVALLVRAQGAADAKAAKFEALSHEAQQQMGSLSSKFHVSQRRLADAIGRVAELETSKDDLKQKLSSSRSVEIEQPSVDVRSSEGEVNDMREAQQHVELLSGALLGAREKLSDAFDRVTSIESSKADLKEKLNTMASASHAMLEKQVEIQSGELRNVREKLSEALDRVADVESSKFDLKEKLCLLTSGSHDMFEKLKAARAETRHFKNQIMGIREALKACDKQNVACKDSEQKLENECDLVEQICAIEKSFEKERERNVSLGKKLNEKIKEASSLRRELEETHAEQLEDTEQLLKALENLTCEHAEAIDAKNKELLETKAANETHVADLLESLRNANSQIQEYKLELEELRTQHGVEKANVLSLRSELKQIQEEQLKDTDQLLEALETLASEHAEAILAKDRELVESKTANEAHMNELQESLRTVNCQVKEYQVQLEEERTQHGVERSNLSGAVLQLKSDLKKCEADLQANELKLMDFDQCRDEAESTLVAEKKARNELISENADISASLARSQEKVAELSLQLQTCKQEIAARKKTNSELSMKCTFFEEEFLESQTRASDAEKQATNRLRRVKEMEDDMGAMANEIDILIKTNSLLEDQLIELKTAKASSQSEAETKLAMVESLQKSLAISVEKESDTKTRIDFLTSTLADANSALVASEAAMKSKENALLDSDKELKRVQSQVAEKIEALDTLNTEVSLLAKARTVADAKASKFETLSKETQHQMYCLSDKLQATEKKLSDSLDTVEELEMSRADLKQKLNAISTGSNEIFEQLTAARDAIIRLENEVHVLRETRQQVEPLSAELNCVRGKLSEALNRVSELESLRDDLKKKLCSMTSDESAMLEKLQAAQDNSSHLETQLRDAGASLLQLKEAQKIRDQHTDVEISRLQNLLTEAESHCVSLESQAMSYAGQLEKQREQSQKMEMRRADVVGKLAKASELVSNQKEFSAEQESRALQAEKRAEALSLMVSTLEQTIKANEEQQSSLTLDLQAAEEKCRALKEETSSTGIVSDDLQGKESLVLELRARLEELSSICAVREIKIKELRDDLSSSKEYSQQLQNRLEERDSTIEHLQANVLELEATKLRLNSDSMFQQEDARQAERKDVRGARLKQDKEISKLRAELRVGASDLNKLVAKVANQSMSAMEHRSIEADLVTFTEKLMRTLHSFIRHVPTTPHRTSNKPSLQALDLAQSSGVETHWDETQSCPVDCDKDLAVLHDVFSRFKSLMESRSFYDHGLADTTSRKPSISASRTEMKELLKKEHEVTLLTNDNDKLRQVLLSLDLEMDCLVRDLQSARDELSSKEESFAELEMMLAQCETERVDLSEKVRSMTAYIKEMERRQGAPETHLSRLENHFDQSDDAKTAAARTICTFLQKHDDKLASNALRKWECAAISRKAVAQQRQVAEATARQLEITREKLSQLKTHLHYNTRPL